MKTESKQLTPQQLALYLMCEAEYNQIDLSGDGPEKYYDKISGIDISLVEQGTNNYQITPILRKLSDITEEEFNACLPNGHYELAKAEGFRLDRVLVYPSETVSLLSIGIDLFNWIPEGLAIEKA